MSIIKGCEFMKLVTMTKVCSDRFGDIQAIKMIKDAGFDGYDFSMFEHNQQFWDSDGWKEYVENLKSMADKIGIPCLQMHAPCPTMRTINDVVPLEKTFLRAIDIAEILGCKMLVVHPGSFLSAQENKKYIYDKILPHAKEKSVKIATENMFKWKDETETETVPSACGTAKDFVEHIDCINDENFVACMDIGHAEMVNCEGSIKIIRALGKRIGCLHVHDNNLYNDLHTFPFCGKINWLEVAKVLKEVDYNGYFTFEADSFMKNYPNELIPACLELLEKTGRYLIGLINKA